MLVESKVVEPVGEGVDVRDELRPCGVDRGAEEERRVEGGLLPQERVDQLDHGREQVALQVQLLDGIDFHIICQFSELKTRGQWTFRPVATRARNLN